MEWQDSDFLVQCRYGYYHYSETGMYYLQSRYYDPEIGRFVNADEASVVFLSKNANGHNHFSYCDNSIVSFKDSSGFLVETVLDIAGIIWSLIDLISKPSWANLGYLAWDLGAALIPFIPGSYVAKGGKIVLKIASKIDDFVDGTKVLTGAYKKLKNVFRGIKGIEIHHLVEKRFRVLFKGCNVNDFLSVPLTKELHQVITRRWRNLHKKSNYFKYFKYGSRYTYITYTMMEKALKGVYKDMPQLLEEVLEWFRKNWGKINGKFNG